VAAELQHPGGWFPATGKEPLYDHRGPEDLALYGVASEAAGAFQVVIPDLPVAPHGPRCSERSSGQASHPGEFQHCEGQVVVHLAPELLVVPAEAGADAAAADTASGDLDAQLPSADPARSSQPGVH
jgi:hypothetical protein